MEQKLTPCSRCFDLVDTLAIFPKGLCLSCYAHDHDQDTPAQDYATIMQVFGGR